MEGSEIVGAFVGMIVLFFIILALINFIAGVNDITTKNQCAPYIGQISDMNVQINGLEDSLSTVSDKLLSCQNDYNYLVQNTVTKVDVNLIQDNIQIVQSQVNNLNARLDKVSANYFNFQQTTVNNFNFSLALNLILSLEVVSFAFLKSEFAIFAIEWVKKRRKKHEKHE